MSLSYREIIPLNDLFKYRFRRLNPTTHGGENYLLVVLTDLRQVSNLETRPQEIQEFFLSVPMLNKFSVFKKNPFGLQIQRFDEIPP